MPRARSAVLAENINRGRYIRLHNAKHFCEKYFTMGKGSVDCTTANFLVLLLCKMKPLGEGGARILETSLYYFCNYLPYNYFKIKTFFESRY